MKQFKEFEAIVPYNFANLMVNFWVSNENSNKDTVIKAYYNDSFKTLEKRITGTKCKFKPDLGYKDAKIDGTLCFELKDDNWVIPIEILELI